MLPRIKIRFQAWAIASTAALVLLLAAAFLLTVVRSFEAISEDNADARFSLIAGQATDRLESLLEQNRRYVFMQSRAEAGRFVRDGRLNGDDRVPPFLASLEADPTLYSHFFALANEEFLQVIAVRDDPRIRAALAAPPGTWFAVRRIQADGRGGRRDRYRFLDAGRRDIGGREQAASLVPSQRPWYGLAQERGGVAVAEPYLFASTGELGITVAAPLAGGIGVVATDISLRSLQGFLGGLALTANGAVVVADRAGRILGFHGRGKPFGGLAVAPMTPPQDVASDLLKSLLLQAAAGRSGIVTAADGQRHVLTSHANGAGIRVLVLAPLADFTGVFREAERNVLLVSLLVLLVLLPLAFIGSRQVARTLAALAEDSEHLKRLDFSREPERRDSFLYEISTLGEAQAVMHEAIKRRTGELERAQKKLAQLVDNGISLSREQDRTELLRHILFGARDIAHCQAATLFLSTEQQTLAFALRTSDDPLPVQEIPLYDASGRPNDRFVAVHAALNNCTVLIDDVYRETRFDLSGTKRFSEESGLRAVSMLTVPLSPREGEVTGVIQLLNALDPATGAVTAFPEDLVGFIEALAAQSAVALENRSLIEAQRAMMDALIKLIAGAIDAKSAYTGGHCERVPELALMLAEEACRVQEGPLAGFRFESDEEWREFRIGAWLHDCGKVTTPEYVVDKATKLETIYNRIHEVRLRFEVLLRDARIDELEAVAAGADPDAAAARFAARREQLFDDFAFVADCNLGGEFMAAERLERLRRIAAQTWRRHFDDRLGLAHDELRRQPAEIAPLPATEALLADKPGHIVPRLNQDIADPRWGFKVQVPEHLYNHGELYNLSVARGTLTEEERFKINEHVMQSLMMLEQLPLPKSMRRVPAYAGTHHETLVGSGYPRRLGEAELTVPMRIMAIADIFEALTASDRPYKKAKTLSEAVHILSLFKRDRHVDPDLFDLFLRSGVYRRYGEKYLRPEQIDEVDVAAYVG